jgi:hypothetical protein
MSSELPTYNSDRTQAIAWLRGVLTAMLEACVREGARKMLGIFDIQHDLFRRWSGCTIEED